MIGEFGFAQGDGGEEAVLGGGVRARGRLERCHVADGSARRGVEVGDDGRVRRVLGGSLEARNLVEGVPMDNVDRDFPLGGHREPPEAVGEDGIVVEDDGRHADVEASLSATTGVSEAVEDAGSGLEGEEDLHSFRVEADGEFSFTLEAVEVAHGGHIPEGCASTVAANGEGDSAEEYSSFVGDVEDAERVMADGEELGEVARGRAALRVSV